VVLGLHVSHLHVFSVSHPVGLDVIRATTTNQQHGEVRTVAVLLILLTLLRSCQLCLSSMMSIVAAMRISPHSQLSDLHYLQYFL